MIEDITVLGLVVIILLVAFIAFFFIWGITVRRRRIRMREPEALKEVSDARVEKGEMQASLIGEQIEERVKQILAQKGKLAELVLDFGTAEDGSLEIWIDEKRYTLVSEIPDSDVRDAVAQAVEEFNR
jgi:flagellar biosynthesis/type III secretory pathway M-ring protein FliF/YscJ